MTTTKLTKIPTTKPKRERTRHHHNLPGHHRSCPGTKEIRIRHDPNTKHYYLALTCPCGADRTPSHTQYPTLTQAEQAYQGALK